jgi:hypothetical protein
LPKGSLQFDLTPKALANFSPAVGAQRQPWDTSATGGLNPERRLATGEPFQGCNELLGSTPAFSLCSNTGLKLANAFSVKNQTEPASYLVVAEQIDFLGS